MKLITDLKAHTMVRDAVTRERDTFRVERASQDQTIKALQRQVQALSDQQQAQTAARNVDAEKLNDLMEKNDNQRRVITDLQTEVENATGVINEKNSIIASSERTQTVDEQAKRIGYLQDEMEEFNKVWSTLNEAALEVANDNGYCEEFDNLVDKVNDELQRLTKGRFMLAKRTKEYNVTLVLEVSIEEAMDEDDAIQQAKDNLDNGSYGTYELDNYGTSAQEV